MITAYTLLTTGLLLIIGLTLVLFRNYRNSSKRNFTFTSVDALIGISAGIYLVVTSLQSIIF